MLYFFLFLVRCGGGVGAKIRKSENQKITFRFSVLSASPLMASVERGIIDHGDYDKLSLGDKLKH